MKLKNKCVLTGQLFTIKPNIYQKLQYAFDTRKLLFFWKKFLEIGAGYQEWDVDYTIISSNPKAD